MKRNQSGDGLLKQWPLGGDGEPEEAALLETEGDFAGYAGIHCSILESFGIPYLTSRSSYGQLGLIYGGYSLAGVKIYVPKSRLAEAKEILEAAAAEPDAEDTKEETP